MCMACLGSALLSHQPDILAISGTHTLKDLTKWSISGGEKAGYPLGDRASLMWLVASLRTGMEVPEVAEMQLPTPWRD